MWSGMNKKSSRLIIFTAFVMLGIVASMQFRGVNKTEPSGTDKSDEIQQMIKSIDRLREKNAALEAEISSEMKRTSELEKLFIRQQKDIYLEQLFGDIQQMRMNAGLVDVTGPGLIINMDDAAARQTTEMGLLVIHDSDIKAILNDLKIAGAQAISINGERIIATSEQICAGPTIRINWRKYAVPYRIHVIGNPDRLNRALKNSEQLAYMIRDRIKVDIRFTRKVEVPAFKTGEKNLEDYIDMLEVVDNEAG